jgi:hypothetical protein
VTRLGWNASLRVLALLLAVFMVAGTVLQLVLQFNLTGSPLEFTKPGSDQIMAEFQFEHGRWPIDFASQALFALAFLALGGVGILLSRLADSVDSRGVLAPAAFLGSGLLGAAASLVWIGVAPVATDPHYCTCDLRDALLAARVTAIDVSGNVGVWLTNGAIVLASIAFVLVVGLARRAGMSASWAVITYLTAATGLLSVGQGSLMITPSADIPVDAYLALAVAGILIPVWALWLAIRAPHLAGPDDMAAEPPLDSGLTA